VKEETLSEVLNLFGFLQRFSFLVFLGSGDPEA